MQDKARKLSLFHFFCGLAMSTTGSFVFIDAIFLRMGLSMSQFGLIKAFGFLIPLLINFVLSPMISRWNKDHLIISWGYLLRVFLPFGFLGLPYLSHNTTTLTVASTLLLIFVLIWPALANNSLEVIFKRSIPKKQLGSQVARFTLLWGLPYSLVAIPASLYIQQYNNTSDDAYYRAIMVVFLCASFFQLPASWFISRVKNTPTPETPQAPPKVSPLASDVSLFPVEAAVPAKPIRQGHWAQVFEPFRNRNFRQLLSAILALGTVIGMVGTYIVPYLLQGLSWSLTAVTVATTATALLGLFMMQFWGHIADRLGPRNLIRLTLFTVAVSTFGFAGTHWITLTFAVIAAWPLGGLLGSALAICQRCLVLSLCDENKSHSYVAAASMVFILGSSAGSIIGGVILDWLGGRMKSEFPLAHYQIYFAFCAMGYLLIVELLAAVRDGNKKRTGTAMTMQIYRILRSVTWRPRYAPPF